MKRLLFYMSLVVSSACALFAEETKDKEPSLTPSASPEAPPSSFVNSVHVTTGTLCFSTVDLTVPGPVPLTVTHHYNSDTSFYSWMGYSSFASNFPLFLENHIEKSICQTHLETHFLTVDEGNGGISQYHGRTVKDNHQICYLEKSYIKKGFTNARGDKISGRTNLKNNRYILIPKEKHGHRCTAHLCDGVRRYFDSSEKDHRWLNLYTEVLASGNKLSFSYYKPNYKESYKENLLKKIEATNSEKKSAFGSLSFECDKEHGKAHIFASNGKEATYHFFNGEEEKNPIGYIEKIVSSDSPTVKFHYTSRDKNYPKSYRIDRIDWPEGRYLEMEYNDKGNVVAQKAPCGSNGEKHTIWSFEYRPHDRTTYVRDAYDRKTTYHYSSENRITEINKYTKDHALYRSEYFHWGKGEELRNGHRDESDEGNLLSKAIADETGKGLFCWKAKYDEHGNIIKETICGNLSGTCKNHFKVTDDVEPKDDEVEKYHKYATYSPHRMHLPLSESEDDGPSVQYSYKPSTDLVTEKFILNGDEIKIREFFSYNENGILVKKSIDDGSSHDRDNLKNVTERKIVYIKPVQSEGDYGVGQPEEVKEYYLDLKTNNGEMLLKRVTYKYNKAGSLTQEKVYDSNNDLQYTLTFTYDDKERVISKTDPLGHKYCYEYDENGNKTYEELKGSGSYTKFKYDAMNRLIQTSVHVDTGEVFTTQYSYNLLGNLVEKTDHFGNVTEYSYDDCNRCIQTTLPKTDAGKAQIKKSYDIFDKVISETDANGNTTEYSRNVRGQPTEVVYPDGSKEQFEYNLNGTLKYKWEKNGLQHHYKYDFLRRPIEEKVSDSAHEALYTITNQYNTFHLISATDPMGFTTSYCYDGAGRKIEEKKEKSKTTFHYDSMGRVAVVRNWLNDKDFTETSTSYDALDRIVGKEVHTSGNAILCKERYEYDIHGNKCEVAVLRDAKTSFSTRTEYNAMNLIALSVDELHNSTKTSYDFHYKNELGQCTLKTIEVDPLGRETKTYFDAQQRPVAVINKKGSTRLSATYISYDLAGNVIKKKNEVIVNGEKERDYVVTWKYDSCNRPIKIKEQPDTESEKKTEQEYTLSGAVKTIYKPNGVTLYHTYDALNRLKTLSSSDKTIQYNYSFDLNNNLIAVEDVVHHFTQHKTYDAENHLTREEFFQSVLSYTHDAFGRVTTVTLPDGSSTKYLYNGGHTSDVVRLNSSGKESYRHSYSKVNLCEEVVENILPMNNGTLTSSWDVKGRAIAIDGPHFHEAVGKIDACDNVKEIHLTDALGSADNRYTYDDLDQIASESGLFEHSYSHDSIANRRKKDHNPYKIDLLNRLSSSTEATFSYDKNGNMVASIQNGVTTQYRYDALDRLIGVVSPTMKAEYFYDSLNRRLQKKVFKTIPGGWSVTKNERYFYIGKCEIGCLDEAGVIQQLRILGRGKGADIGAAVAMELNGTPYVPIHDARGNVVELLDGSHKVAETVHYSAFGEFVCDKPLSPWLFVSKRYDEETGFFYFGERYYSASIGRWVTPDPLGFADGPNLYAYVHNDPMLLIDPYGLATEGDSTAASSQPSAPAQGTSSPAPKETLSPPSTRRYRDSYGRFHTCFKYDVYYNADGSISASNVPENFQGSKEPCVIQIHGPAGPISNGLVVGINGVLTSVNNAVQHGIYLSSKVGGHDVTWVYNNSTGAPGIVNLSKNVSGVSTRACDLLTDIVLDFLKNSPTGELSVVAHSQGTAQARIMASRINPTLQQRVSVLMVAPIRYLTLHNLKSVQHLVSKRDQWITRADCLNFDMKNTKMEKEIAIAEHTVTFLDPAEGAPENDHDFESPTFANGIEKFLRDRNQGAQ